MTTIEEMKATAKSMRGQDLLTEYETAVIRKREAFEKDAFGEDYRNALNALQVIRDELMNRLVGI